MLLRALCVTVVLVGTCSGAHAVAFFSTPNLQGSGNGSGVLGSQPVTYSGSSNVSFTASGGGGGTSGGLGDGVTTVATTFSNCNGAIRSAVLPSGLVETTIEFSMTSITRSLQVPDAFGSIQSGAQLDVYIDVPGVGLLPYTVERFGNFATGSFVPHSNGASVNGGFLTPGRYLATVSVSSWLSFSPSTFIQAGSGGGYIIKIIPAPATIGVLGCVSPLAMRQRRTR
jgi:hypothetical protein